ncbi:hypothetical protein PRUPE_7G080300 [Prunus persica]|uniref:Uncharacterized protein n=1 Tax=Prunus persica TaxID=3760 RepID=A0A251N8D0_PRUPE|nr:hypothetical protein PRUPE_7G080300 [Prunus persica]
MTALRVLLLPVQNAHLIEALSQLPLFHFLKLYCSTHLEYSPTSPKTTLLFEKQNTTNLFIYQSYLHC